MFTLSSIGLPAVRGQEDYVARIVNTPIGQDEFMALRQVAKHVGVTQELIEVVDYFKTPKGHTPAGFRRVVKLDHEAVVRVDLERDISRDQDGLPRPTRVLFSADTANPYELAPVAPIVAKLTCNPGIIYDLFLNNPEANVGRKFTTRDEVMTEIGRILGPGADISVELNDPFADFEAVLDEAEKFREMLSKWRVVIKVPHMGPVNRDNVSQLLSGSGKLDRRWWQPATRDTFAAHALALKLKEHGFRVNFTLMFEPHQAMLALQARPAYINSFVRHRLIQTNKLAGMLEQFEASKDEAILDEMRTYLIDTDNLAAGDTDYDLGEVAAIASRLVSYRKIKTPEGSDGLDAARHNLRVLRAANLPDTRLIFCSMEGPAMYPDIDKMLAEPEFADMLGQVVITAEPQYLARFTSSSFVVSYQRRFMKAAQGEH